MALGDCECHECTVTNRINVYKFTDTGRQNVENASRFVAERCIFLPASLCNFTPQKSEKARKRSTINLNLLKSKFLLAPGLMGGLSP